MSVAALAATLAISTFTVNRHVSRRLRLSLFLFGAYFLAHLLLAAKPDVFGAVSADQVRALERLTFAAGLVNLLVIAAINPLRENRVPDGFPAILQDSIVIGLVILISTFAFRDQLITTSAVSAVVVGFALQDTLGNAFAGLAIQTEKPFNIGHWIRVGDFEGRVAEITWRATRLRTKAGNFVIVPNNIIGKEAITNFSEPVAPTRLEVDVGVTYSAAPTRVKSVIKEAIAQVPRVLKTPKPDVLLLSFADSSVVYRARFWIDDYEMDDESRDEVRTAIYYAFSRNAIEIPYPIQVEYGMPPPQIDEPARERERETLIAGVDIFTSLSADQVREIARATTTVVYGDGETIVREGEPGDSLFLVCSGSVAVMLEHERKQIARTDAGGYFGEMSLLTGDPRSASVVARGDVVVLEITADVFRQFAAAHPRTVEQIGVAAAARRAELNQARTAARGAAVADAPATFLSRMKRFLRIG